MSRAAIKSLATRQLEMKRRMIDGEYKRQPSTILCPGCQERVIVQSGAVIDHMDANEWPLKPCRFSGRPY